MLNGLMHHCSFTSVTSKFKSWSPDQHCVIFTSPQIHTRANIFKYVLFPNSPQNPRTDQNTWNTKLPTYMVHDKGIGVPYRLRRHIRGGEVYLHSVSTLSLEGRDQSTSCSCCFNPKKEPKYTTNMKMGGA